MHDSRQHPADPAELVDGSLPFPLPSPLPAAEAGLEEENLEENLEEIQEEEDELMEMRSSFQSGWQGLYSCCPQKRLGPVLGKGWWRSGWSSNAG